MCIRDSISAARRDMLGGTLYLVGRDAKTHELLEDTMPCSLCKRLIINAGITQVVVRTGTESNRVIHVRDWVDVYKRQVLVRRCWVAL